MIPAEFDTTTILGVPYAELDYASASSWITRWAAAGERRYVVVAPVSSLMFVRSDRELGEVYRRASIIASDGMPIVWARRALGRAGATRLYGPDLMLSVLRRCETDGVPVGFVGGRPERLQGLTDEVGRRFPGVEIAHASSPPFRDLTDAEVRDLARAISTSGARVTFVGMSSPKQERLMARLCPDLPGVQIGVGAAFDFIPGYVRQAPPLLQKCGLEWAFRIFCEPRRLWKRYATTIPPFIAGVTSQIVRQRVIDPIFSERSTA
jgi:N-acetylglucosaminyldiphosphoundecaprenol N-acetyl-beta-D-mannosaminyltransferase